MGGLGRRETESLKMGVDSSFLSGKMCRVVSVERDLGGIVDAGRGCST